MHITKPNQHFSKIKTKGGGTLYHTINGFTNNLKSNKYRTIHQQEKPVIDLNKPIVNDMMKGANPEGGHSTLMRERPVIKGEGLYSEHNVITKPLVNKATKTAEAMVANAKESAKEVLQQARLASEEMSRASMNKPVEKPGALSTSLGTGRGRGRPKKAPGTGGGIKMGYGLSSY